MGGARFVYISDGVDVVREHGDGPARVWWQLVAANNRVLGRSAGTVGDEDECRRRAAELCERIAEADSASATNQRGQWTWVVSLDGVEYAECAHPFPRRVDSVRTLALFLDGMREADAFAGPVRYFTGGNHLPRPNRDEAVPHIDMTAAP